MKRRYINLLMLLNFACISQDSLFAMNEKDTDVKIQEMLWKANYIKARTPELTNTHNSTVQKAFFENNDCQETLVRQMTQYIQENNQNGGCAFSTQTVNLLGLVPNNHLVQAYKIASQKIKDEK
ncbi:hypothetical protein [Candidatus Chromulinivorax destructor]|nr:hypothetical protein [Candidatus Chromulinivorax destructor]